MTPDLNTAASTTAVRRYRLRSVVMGVLALLGWGGFAYVLRTQERVQVAQAVKVPQTAHDHVAKLEPSQGHDRAERDSLAAERDLARMELVGVRAKWDQAVSERNQLLAERNSAQTEIAHLSAQRDEARQEVAALRERLDKILANQAATAQMAASEPARTKGGAEEARSAASEAEPRASRADQVHAPIAPDLGLVAEQDSQRAVGSKAKVPSLSTVKRPPAPDSNVTGGVLAPGSRARAQNDARSARDISRVMNSICRGC